MSRQSRDISRAELVAMVATLRGILVEFDTVYGLPDDCEHEVRLALKQTTFAVNDEDLDGGGFAELEEPKMTTTKRICFHGTNERAAMKILDEGFAADSWFSLHLEDALMCGGPWVFQVVFDTPPEGWGDHDSNWQFHDPDPVGDDRIVALDYHEVDGIVEDAEARKRVFQAATAPQPPTQPLEIGQDVRTTSRLTGYIVDDAEPIKGSIKYMVEFLGGKLWLSPDEVEPVEPKDTEDPS
jgi:hypothetical protein